MIIEEVFSNSFKKKIYILVTCVVGEAKLMMEFDKFGGSHEDNSV